MIHGVCPKCGRLFKVDDRYAGLTGRCRKCGATVQVPGQPDEGLAGLPPLEESTQPSEPAAPSEPAPPPAPPPPEPPAAEAEPPPEPPAREIGSLEPHDSRSRYEPPQGPTALAGSWLKDEAAQAPPPEAEEDDSGRAPLRDGSPRAIDVLKSSRIVTEVESPAPSSGRPVLVTVACVVLGLLGAAFLLHFVTAGPLGAATAAIGVLLCILGIVRLWTGHSDGMVPGVLFCLGVGGGAWFPSQVPEEIGRAHV